MRGRRRQHGQVLAWYGIMLALALLPVIGLAIDSGVMFTAHRKLQMLADGAARTGAMQVDTTTVYDTGRVTLDTAEAEAAAEAYLASTPGVAGTASATSDRIDVQAQRTVVLPFQSMFGRLPMPIEAAAAAVPCSGIEEGEGAC
jgi:uncharacterized membrane protein